MTLLASSYPLLDVFLTTLWIVGFIMWIWLVIAVFTDIFRSHDMGGWAKAAWVLAVFVLPLVGVLVYLIARGHKMREHAESDAAAMDLAQRQYIREVASTTPTPDEMAKLVDLRDKGAISNEEYEQMKSQMTGTGS